MTDDATLSEFAADEQGDSRSDSEAPTPDGTGEATDGESAQGTEGAVPSDEAGGAEATGETTLSTYAWGAYTCSRCEAAVERVWRDEGELVCPDCKPW